MRNAYLRELPTNEIRVAYSLPKDPIHIRDSDMAAEIFMRVWDSDLINIQEQFYVLFLNRSNTLVAWRLISTGTTDQTLVDIKLLVALACKVLATSVIVAHNHPSGSITPSKADMDTTCKLRDALHVFGIDLADHMIMTSQTYFSFANEGFIQGKESFFLNEIKIKRNCLPEGFKKRDSAVKIRKAATVIQSENRTGTDLSNILSAVEKKTDMMLSRSNKLYELNKKQKAKLSLIEQNHNEILDSFDAKKEDVLQALDSFFGCWLSNPFQIPYSKDEKQNYFELYLALKKQVELMEYMPKEKAILAGLM